MSLGLSTTGMWECIKKGLIHSTLLDLGCCEMIHSNKIYRCAFPLVNWLIRFFCSSLCSHCCKIFQWPPTWKPDRKTQTQIVTPTWSTSPTICFQEATLHDELHQYTHKQTQLTSFNGSTWVAVKVLRCCTFASCISLKRKNKSRGYREGH